MSLTTKVLIGLVAGLILGILISLNPSPDLQPALDTVVRVIAPVGTLWVNAIRMTVIPLVVATLIVGVASAPDPRSVGRIGSRAFGVFLAMLIAAAIFTSLLAPPILAMLDVDPAAAQAMREAAASTTAAATATELPTITDFIVGLVPVNPIRAAADGSMLPLIIFSILFGLAVMRVEAPRRDAFLRGVQAIADASMVLVRWILELAPIGVFALAVPLATRLGISAAGAVAFYIALVSTLLLGIIAALYVVAVVFGRAPFRLFAQATAPAQAVAFSSRSSLAALPAMIAGATTKLRLPAEITGFFLPLSASVFRIGSVVGMMGGVLFIARLYGQDVSLAQLLAIAATTIALTFSVPGVPGGTILVMIPVLTAAGLPIEGIGILLGVDTIPDMFRTTANVTGHMTAGSILGRGALATKEMREATLQLPDAA